MGPGAILFWIFGGIVGVVGLICIFGAVADENEKTRNTLAVTAILLMVVALLLLGINAAGTNAAVHGVSLKDIGGGEYKIVYLNADLQKSAINLILLVPIRGNETVPKFYELSTQWLRGTIPQNPYELVVSKYPPWGYYEILPKQQ